MVDMMEAWASVAGMETLAGELLDVLNSPKCTGDGKADGIGWLAKRVGFASMIWGSVCVRVCVCVCVCDVEADGINWLAKRMGFASMICVCVCEISRRMASIGWPRGWVLRL